MIFKFLFTITIFSILVVPWACNFGSTRPDDSLEYDATQYERVSVNYQIEGKRDTTVLFIHGWNLNKSYWDNQVKDLSTRYKVVTLDLAGHGKSSKDRVNWTAESFARDIISIIEKDSLEKVILVGHSFGGEIALQIYESIPDRIIGIIGVENFKDVSFTVTRQFVEDFKEHLDKFKGNYEEMADAVARDNLRSADRDVINRVVNDYKNADPKIALAIFKNMVPKYEENKYLLQKLRFPLRIIASDYEPYNEEALKQYAQEGYEILWIQDAGHFPMIEQPEQFQDALNQFLNKVK